MRIRTQPNSNQTVTFVILVMVVASLSTRALFCHVQVNVGDKVIEQGDDGDNFYVVGQ